MFVSHCCLWCRSQGSNENGEGASGSPANAESSVNGEADDSAYDGKDSQEKDGKKKKNRCATCRKKVGLTGTFTDYARLRWFLRFALGRVVSLVLFRPRGNLTYQGQPNLLAKCNSPNLTPPTQTEPHQV